jgi:ATP-dependent Lon protease
LHVHFPAGAIPKDGPSAGAAVTIVIASILSGRPVRRDLALTGEVTLRGKVLEIGGVKEKVLAAYRAGLRHLVLPVSNQKDLRDVSNEVRAIMKFTFVDSMDQIIQLALLPRPQAGLVDVREQTAPAETRPADLPDKDEQRETPAAATSPSDAPAR